MQEALVGRYDVHLLSAEADPIAYCEAHGAEFDGAVTRSRDGCSTAIMRSLPKGSVVACFGVGYDPIDMVTARERGIQVSITPDVLNECVADLAMGLLIASARSIVAADRFLQRGDWLRGGAFPLATRVSHKKIGILGLGRIGRAIATRATGFGMQVRYHGRSAQADVPYGFEPDLLAMAQWCDFLVVSCVGGAATNRLVSADVLAAIGPRGFLVNIARGSVVDEAALVEALRDGKLGGAGLDVYEREPQVPAGLLANDKVVVLPHVAASTRETRADMVQLVLDNLDAFFNQGRVLTPPA
jgi:lactate dehydrogenase-like 2-hydroxyacid dehydrogenase